MKLSFDSVLKLGLLLSLLCALVASADLEPYGLPLDQDMHCDDCSSGNVIPNGYSIVYFGETYHTMFVSSNGMISLGKPGSTQLSFDTIPIIAPYLFDLDTQLQNNNVVDGTVFYRTEVGDDPDFDQFVLDNFGINFFNAYTVVVTYDRVKMKGDDTSALRNTFQAVIYVSAYGDTSICYNYPPNGLNWPEQNAQAFPLVGFYSGPDLNIAYYLPGSGTADAANLDSIPGNFGEVGQFCYMVNGLAVGDTCLITSLSCRAPAYFPINTPLTVDNVLSTYSKCNTENITLSTTSFTCNDVGQLMSVTAAIGDNSCNAYFIPTVNVPLAYLNCPADITVFSSVATTVMWTPPTAVGDCLAHETFSATPGVTFFPVGSTTVNYNAYDAQFHSVSCSFSVTVAPPVVISYQVIDVLNRPIVNAAISAYPDCAPTDAHGICSVEAPAYHVGDTIPDGFFYITWNGNVYVIHHDSILVDCVNLKIQIIISPPGFYRTSAGDIIACTAGTYSSQYEATSCISCPPGLYTDDDIATFCEVCPLGFTSGEGATECFSCTAGNFLNSNSGLCEFCPAGTFSCDRAIDCEPCPIGSYSTAGSAECFYCTAGFFLDTNAKSCQPCPTGTFSRDRASECTPCPDGGYSNQGSAECSFCVAGFFLDATTGTCSPCPGGTISCDRATECTACPEGGFASPGSSECSFCVAGYFMGMDESLGPCGCSPCPAGTFSCDRSEECQECPPGTWSMEGSSSCFSCTAGYFLDITSGMCELCPANTFSADHAFDCTACPTGSFSAPGSSFCSYCVAGYFFDAASQMCLICPGGTFSNDRATECTPCQLGSYSFPGSDSCIFCTAGYYLDQNSQSCIPCPGGTTSCDRAVQCTPCPDGSFSYPGSAVCIFCDAGYFFDDLSQSCLPCAAGFFSLDRAIVCTPCPAGFFSLPGSEFCYSCTAGFYLDTTTGACIQCPPGFTSGDRALSCTEIPVPPVNEVIQCTAGNYLDIATETCLPCPANSYSNDNALTCIQCPPGSFSAAQASVCTFCTQGFFANIDLGMCVACPVNTFSADRATQCIPCPYGYTAPPGSAFCTPCPDGTVYNPNNNQCELCPMDTFFLGGICLPCDFMVPDECLVCPPGHEAVLECEECCAGYFSPNGGSCEPCPPYTFSGNGFAYCVTCPMGAHWNPRKEMCEFDSSTSGGCESACESGHHD